MTIMLHTEGVQEFLFVDLDVKVAWQLLTYMDAQQQQAAYDEVEQRRLGHDGAAVASIVGHSSSSRGLSRLHARE